AKGGGAASAPAELAMGFAVAQQIVQSQPSLIQPQPPPLPGGPASAPGALDLLSPADAARLLGVSEADVLTSIAAGDLKAKKIGAAYRITRAALDEFLK
ncbi:MAG: helix-turn-helix domain-containing protein, partial [Verrucomicrobia bacterium]|nr:helix-turn-helix domain-containing protein [Verrucomicrobiota bacterium]